MTTPFPLRKIPGWLYAVLSVSLLASFMVLVETGFTDQVPTLLGIITPLLGGVFVADRVTAVSKAEGETTRQTMQNGGFTAGMLTALNHPDVRAKISALAQSDSRPPVVTDPAPSPPVATP